MLEIKGVITITIDLSDPDQINDAETLLLTLHRKRLEDIPTIVPTMPKIEVVPEKKENIYPVVESIEITHDKPNGYKYPRGIHECAGCHKNKQMFSRGYCDKCYYINVTKPKQKEKAAAREQAKLNTKSTHQVPETTFQQQKALEREIHDKPIVDRIKLSERCHNPNCDMKNVVNWSPEPDEIVQRNNHVHCGQYDADHCLACSMEDEA